MHQNDSFYIVGIGLSAGGLPALRELLSSLHTPVKASFVVVAHLPVESNSHLDKLLTNVTPMEVSWIKPGEQPQPNCLHLLPPGYLLTMQDGAFHLQRREKIHQINRSIDIFFTSLAREVQQRAIGVILSGTGSDGLVGVHAIEAYGGIVLVQHPATAQFESMPVNVVSKDHPDFDCN